MEKGKGGLKREVGLFGVIAIAAGSVIGAGQWFWPVEPQRFAALLSG